MYSIHSLSAGCCATWSDSYHGGLRCTTVPRALGCPIVSPAPHPHTFGAGFFMRAFPLCNNRPCALDTIQYLTVGIAANGRVQCCTLYYTLTHDLRHRTRGTLQYTVIHPTKTCNTERTVHYAARPACRLIAIDIGSMVRRTVTDCVEANRVL